jgi:hypothetical protein
MDLAGGSLRWLGRLFDWNDASWWDGRTEILRARGPRAHGATVCKGRRLHEGMPRGAVAAQPKRTTAIGPVTKTVINAMLRRFEDPKKHDRVLGWTAGFTALRQDRRDEKEGGRRLAAPPSVLDLGRRSGRFPPLPYPPPRQVNFNKAFGLEGRNPAQKNPGGTLDPRGSFRDDKSKQTFCRGTSRVAWRPAARRRA